MNNQNQEQPITPEITPEQKPKPKPKPKLPNWASILIIVIAAIIVVGLVSWAGYELFKPAPSKLPEGGEVEEDEFADWKTYQNEKYGFEFRYPDSFAVREGGTPLETPKTFEIYLIDQEDLPPSSLNIALYLVSKYPYERVLSTYNIVYSNGQHIRDGEPVQQIEVNEEKAITFDINLSWLGKDYKGRENAMYTKVIIKKDRYTYLLMGVEDFKTIFNQILSTFKFTE